MTVRADITTIPSHAEVIPQKAVSGRVLTETEGAAVATIRFDDGRTDVASLITATTNAGYPSRVAK